jgi:hypothetical protein
VMDVDQVDDVAPRNPIEVVPDRTRRDEKQGDSRFGNLCPS